MIDPIIMGVDVARYGNERTEIAVQRGGRSRYREQLPSDISLSDAAILVLRAAHRFDATEIVVDVTGLGAAMADELRRHGMKVREVRPPNHAFALTFMPDGAQ